MNSNPIMTITTCQMSVQQAAAWAKLWDILLSPNDDATPGGTNQSRQSSNWPGNACGQRILQEKNTAGPKMAEAQGRNP
jgi:hypothetical protein